MRRNKLKKWYYCDNKLGVRLQIGAYKYLQVPYGKSEIDASIASKYPELLKELNEEKVLLVEQPVTVESTVEIVEKEIVARPKTKNKAKTKRKYKKRKK